MEIFGIPVFLILLIAFWAWSSYSDEQQKTAEQITRKWNSIAKGMSRDEVLQKLGKPNRLAEKGIQEIWGYGPNNSDGLIFFIEDQVVGFQKPSCTANVTVT